VTQAKIASVLHDELGSIVSTATVSDPGEDS